MIPGSQPAARSPRIARRMLLWLAVTALFWLAIVTAAMTVSDATSSALLYQGLLFPLCTFPALVLSGEPRYRLLAFFMLVYYALFGLLDLVLMFTVSTYHIYEGVTLERTDFGGWLIITTGLTLVAAYVLTARMWPRTRHGARGLWSYKACLIGGLVAWAVGTWANFIVQFVYATQGPQEVGVTSVIISNLYYLSFLGDALLVVTAVSYPGRLAPWLLITVMAVVEYAFGFIGNIKEISYRLPALVMITLFFSRGRVNTKLIALIIISFVPYQALFNVYREQVLQVQRRTALQAADAATQSVDTVLHSFERQRDAMLKSTFIMLDRIDGRKYVEIITQHAGVNVPYQDGETLKLFVYSFVPKVIWADKPQISTGQLMNRTFKLSASPLTFVPSTMLGEFYWNYGIAGALLGMLCLGIVFGAINCVFLPDDRFSTARMLALLVAAYFLAARFEASIGSQFGQLIRVLLILAVLDSAVGVLGLKRPARGSVHPPGGSRGREGVDALPTPVLPAGFPVPPALILRTGVRPDG